MMQRKQKKTACSISKDFGMKLMKEKIPDGVVQQENELAYLLNDNKQYKRL